MVKVKVDDKVKVKFMVLVLDFQVWFSENLVRINQAGALQLVILFNVKVKVIIKVKDKAKFMVMVPGPQIRSFENFAKIRKARVY